MRICGIDPGISGALATVYLTAAGQPVLERMEDMPTMVDPGTERLIVSPSGLKAALRTMQQGALGFEVWVEKVTPVPPAAFASKGQKMQAGSVAMFGLARAFGIIEGVVAALDIPIRYVPSPTWKAWAGLRGKVKDASRTVALQRYPGATLHLKKHEGKAEALLIATYGAVQYAAAHQHRAGHTVPSP